MENENNEPGLTEAQERLWKALGLDGLEHTHDELEAVAAIAAEARAPLEAERKALISALTAQRELALAAERQLAAVTAERDELQRADYVCDVMCEASQYGGTCRCSQLSNELPAQISRADNAESQRDEALAALREIVEYREGTEQPHEVQVLWGIARRALTQSASIAAEETTE